MKTQAWPSLDYAQWKDTLQTLQRWLQIVGKVKVHRNPWTNHAWHTTYQVTSRGLSTSTIPLGDQSLTMEFDFLRHQLRIDKSEGRSFDLELKAETVASFYKRFRIALHTLGIDVEIQPFPNELPDALSFEADEIHHSYDKAAVERFFHVLVRVNNLMLQFRSEYIGKCSPVHFFWGACDLAVTRFSGKVAPEHPGVAPHISKDVMKEAYSHEVSSCGFWPGNEIYPKAAFYSYAYPADKDFGKAIITPWQSFYHADLGEYILNYDDVATSDRPEKMILDFFRSTYEVAAETGGWDRQNLEESFYLKKLQQKHQVL